MDNENNKTKYGELPKYGSANIREMIDFFTMCSIKLIEDDILLKEINDRQNDLLHDIEIPDKITKAQIEALGKELRNTRRARRIIKDEISLLNPINNFIKNNSTIIPLLETLACTLEGEEDYLKTRSYRVKSQIIAPAKKKEHKKTSESVPETTPTNINITENDRLVIIVNEILGKWSSDYETNIETDNKDCVSDESTTYYNFKIRKEKYDFSAAKSTLMNFRQILEKSIQQLHTEKIEVIQDISDIPIDYGSGYKLGSKFTVYVDSACKYVLNGSVLYNSGKHNKTLKTQKKHKKK